MAVKKDQEDHALVEDFCNFNNFFTGEEGVSQIEEELCCVCGNGFIDEIDQLKCANCGRLCHYDCAGAETEICFECDCTQLDEEE